MRVKDRPFSLILLLHPLNGRIPFKSSHPVVKAGVVGVSVLTRKIQNCNIKQLVSVQHLGGLGYSKIVTLKYTQLLISNINIELEN